MKAPNNLCEQCRNWVIPSKFPKIPHCLYENKFEAIRYMAHLSNICAFYDKKEDGREN